MPYGVANYAYGHSAQPASGDKADQVPRSEYSDAFAAYMQGPGMYGSAASYGYALPSGYGDMNAAAFQYGLVPGQGQQGMPPSAQGPSAQQPSAQAPSSSQIPNST